MAEYMNTHYLGFQDKDHRLPYIDNHRLKPKINNKYRSSKSTYHIITLEPSRIAAFGTGNQNKLSQKCMLNAKSRRC